MPLKRDQKWELHLHSYFADNANTPFVWGTFDCGLFCCGCIQAMTDVDVGLPFRKQNYTDLKSAGKAIMAVSGTGYGIQDAAGYIATQYSLQDVPVLFAQRGDLVLFDGEEGMAAGIVDVGNGRNATFCGQSGLRKVAVSACLKAWRVR